MQPAACDTEAVGQSKACLTKRYTTFPIYHFSDIPLLPYTTFLPLFAFSALGVQGRAEGASVVLDSSGCRARHELAC